MICCIGNPQGRSGCGLAEVTGFLLKPNTMKDNKVISRKRMPVKFPVLLTLNVVLAMDYWQAPQWLWGVMLTFIALLWVGAVAIFVREEQVDVLSWFKSHKQDKPIEESRFEQRIEEIKRRKA